MKHDFVAILSDSSKRIVDYTTDLIGNDAEAFSELMELALQKTKRISPRALWVADYCSRKYHALILPYVPALIARIIEGDESSTIKNILKILIRYTDIDDDILLGQLVNKCFDMLLSSTDTVAIKVYSLEILYTISLREPGLKNELIAVIEDQLPKNSYAFLSRGKRVLSKLQKEL